jgi:hypothetical protein
VAGLAQPLCHVGGGLVFILDQKNVQGVRTLGKNHANYTGSGSGR